MTSLVELGLSNAVASLMLAVVAILVGLACRRPALTHALWLLVLLKLVTPPLVRIPVPWRGAAAEGAASAPVADTTDRLTGLQEDPPGLAEEDEIPWPGEDAEPEVAAEPVRVVLAADDIAATAVPQQWSPEWPAVVGGVWLAGSATWFLLAGARLWRFGRLLRLGRPAPRALTRRVERLAGRLGMASCPPVRLVPGRLPPMVWGVENALLVLPEQLTEQVTPEALDTLLLHELAHLRRRDHLVRLLEFFALGLYWWLPVVWYARRELREVEEQCCDAWVVRTLPGAGRLYANAIVDALDFLSPPPLAVPPLASGLGRVADLKRRLTMIMRGSIPHQLGWGASLVILAAAALLLPLVPSFAQEPPKRDTIRFRDLSGDDLERMEQDLKRKMEEIEALRRKMDATRRAYEEESRRKKEAESNRKRADEERRRAEEAVRKAEAIVKDKLKEVEKRIAAANKAHKLAAETKDRIIRLEGGKGNVVIRIEISGLTEGVQELVERLQKALPKDSRVTLSVDSRKDGERGRNVVVPRGQIRRDDLKIDVRPRNELPKLGSAAPPTPQTAPVTPKPGAAPGSSARNDRRLDSLERRLESIMRELESLRREMRRPGGDGQGRPGRGREEPPAPPAKR
jgi:beta-lactamase regulating signal transducer with metallopeptidase domain